MGWIQICMMHVDLHKRSFDRRGEYSTGNKKST